MWGDARHFFRILSTWVVSTSHSRRAHIIRFSSFPLSHKRKTEIQRHNFIAKCRLFVFCHCRFHMNYARMTNTNIVRIERCLGVRTMLKPFSEKTLIFMIMTPPSTNAERRRRWRRMNEWEIHSWWLDVYSKSSLYTSEVSRRSISWCGTWSARDLSALGWLNMVGGQRPLQMWANNKILLVKCIMFYSSFEHCSHRTKSNA